MLFQMPTERDVPYKCFNADTLYLDLVRIDQRKIYLRIDRASTFLYHHCG
jgi:hypothetical protein